MSVAEPARMPVSANELASVTCRADSAASAAATARGVEQRQTQQGRRLDGIAEKIASLHVCLHTVLPKPPFQPRRILTGSRRNDF